MADICRRIDLYFVRHLHRLVSKNEFFRSMGKALFIWGKTPHLPDPELTGEVNFSHCLYEIFTSPVSPGAERRGGLRSLFREIRKN